MLIIPAETSLDWKRPPWMTIGLMLVCIMVFTFYQSDDSRLEAEAVETYLDTDLMALEAPVYEDYLERQIRFREEQDLIPDLDSFRSLREQNADQWIAIRLMFDQAFYHYLLENRSTIWAPADRERWFEQRSVIQTEYIKEISAFEMGLIPAEFTLYTLITYQFLHGGWGHLIGNLVFLFLLGFTIEKALGAARYLIAYLLCGIAAGAVFTLVSLGSYGPLVGASGSIAGLMGMYMTIYGRQRIRFFYFVWVYFNFFRAPALALLPVLLGKEIYDHFFAGATGVAYMAHAGGLAAGVGLVWLFGKSWFEVREEFYEPAEEEVDERFTASYAQAMASLGRMDFDLAQRQFEALWERYPDRPVLLEHLYQLAKLRPDLPAYRARARELMKDAISRRQSAQIIKVWSEYLGKGEGHSPLAAEDHSRVLFACLREGDLKTAEKAFERLRGSKDQGMIEEACRLLAEEFEKREMSPKARHYRQLMASQS